MIFVGRRSETKVKEERRERSIANRVVLDGSVASVRSGKGCLKDEVRQAPCPAASVEWRGEAFLGSGAKPRFFYYPKDSFLK
jgi:hypothetical protein